MPIRVPLSEDRKSRASVASSVVCFQGLITMGKISERCGAASMLMIWLWRLQGQLSSSGMQKTEPERAPALSPYHRQFEAAILLICNSLLIKTYETYGGVLISTQAVSGQRWVPDRNIFAEALCLSRMYSTLQKSDSMSSWSTGRYYCQRNGASTNTKGCTILRECVKLLAGIDQIRALKISPEVDTLAW